MISDLELFEKLKLFDWLSKKIQNVYSKGEPGLHRAHGRGRILSVLTIENDLSTRELAGRVGIRISSLNEILAKMAEDGLIERIPLKRDRRVKINHLTKKGHELANSITNHPLFECLSESEKNDFGHILDKLNDRLEFLIQQSGAEEVWQSCCHRKEALERFLSHNRE